MPSQKRRQLFVDPNVQGLLIFRIGAYWLCCMAFVTIPLLIARVLTEPDKFFFQQFDDLWLDYWPVVVVAVLMLPLFIYDALRVSNKFAGPICRLRRDLLRLAEGEDVKPIVFRQDDLWQDLAGCFNKVADRLKTAESTSGQ